MTLSLSLWRLGFRAAAHSVLGKEHAKKETLNPSWSRNDKSFAFTKSVGKWAQDLSLN
jgi:hypothetical protein